MRKLAALPVFALLLFGASFAVAQATYVQTTKTCQLTYCANAQFSPSAELSYATNLKVYGGTFQGAAIWNGVGYSDFSGKMLFLGYGNHYPYATWRIQGTFDNGAYTVTEDFECYRTCGSHSNVSGTVVGP